MSKLSPETWKAIGHRGFFGGVGITLAVAAMLGVWVWNESRPEIRTTPTRSDSGSPSGSKLVYFGYENHQETQEDILQLAKQWGTDPPCSNWTATINKQRADYQILFSTTGFTLVGKQGEVIYTGDMGVIHMASGNPDGSGVNLCKMMQ